MSVTPYLHTVWADDIRAEVLNKLTVVGIYTGQAVFPVRPAAFLKLCAWVSFYWPIGEARGQLRISARRDDGVELAVVDVPASSELQVAPPQDGMTTQVIQVGLTMQQLVLPDDCKFLQVVAEIEGGPDIKPSQKLWIIVNPEMAASIGVPAPAPEPASAP